MTPISATRAPVARRLAVVAFAAGADMQARRYVDLKARFITSAPHGGNCKWWACGNELAALRQRERGAADDPRFVSKLRRQDAEMLVKDLRGSRADRAA